LISWQLDPKKVYTYFRKFQELPQMSSEELTDYLYCDDQRINSYFEQISDPVAYDKVPVWKAGLSLTGPTAEGSQARPGRPFTLHEKVQKIVDHLRKSNLVENGRLKHPFADPNRRELPFRIEAMSARKAIIRPQKDMPDSRGLGLWVSTKPDDSTPKIGALFLLEDFRGDDGDYSGSRFSSYSWLALLSETLEVKSLSSDVQTGEHTLTDDLGPGFSADPVDALSRLGAVFGTERRVIALYRVRAACMAHENDFAVTTLGYPLVITAKGGVLNA
jgi:hypothetical protein